VIGSIPDEAAQKTSYDEYVAEFEERTRNAYGTVRERLRRAAERRKARYAVGLRGCPVEAGDWVWYYYPRRYVGKSPKWQRVYIGPYLVVKLIGSINAVIQRSKRAKPFVIHVDKLKKCSDQSAVSWLKQSSDEQCIGSGENAKHDTADQEVACVEPNQIPSVNDDGVNDVGNVENIYLPAALRPSTAPALEPGNNFSSPRDIVRVGDVDSHPKRVRKLPDHLRDFICDRVTMEDKQADELIQQNNVCEVCRQSFTSGFGLTKHLAKVRVNPDHATWLSAHPESQHLVNAMRPGRSRTYVSSTDVIDKTLFPQNRASGPFGSAAAVAGSAVVPASGVPHVHDVTSVAPRTTPASRDQQPDMSTTLMPRPFTHHVNPSCATARLAPSDCVDPDEFYAFASMWAKKIARSCVGWSPDEIVRRHFDTDCFLSYREFRAMIYGLVVQSQMSSAVALAVNQKANTTSVSEPADVALSGMADVIIGLTVSDHKPSSSRIYPVTVVAPSNLGAAIGNADGIKDDQKSDSGSSISRESTDVTREVQQNPQSANVAAA